MTKAQPYPIQITKARGSKIDLHICWSLHNRCNFDCNYCPDYNKVGSEKWLSIELARQLIDKLVEHYCGRLGYKEILLSFTGGEPTLWKGFKELCLYARGKGIRLGLTTNASVHPNYWVDFAKEFEWLAFSYQPEFVDDDRLMATLKQFEKDREICLPAIRFSMMADPVYWRKCLDFTDRIQTELQNYAYEYVHLQDDFGVDIVKQQYTPEQLRLLQDTPQKHHKSYPEWIYEPSTYLQYSVTYSDGKEALLKSNDLINAGFTDFWGWTCYVGLESLFIGYGGEVYRGGCKLGGVIGWATEPNNIRFPTKPLVCTTHSCNCPTNIEISKFAPEFLNKQAQGECLEPR
ncbi:MAG: radical SAM protein [Bdellovibrionaceae bacterium]|nr:radical SAM protein [Bdellovibrionales bacterium]MCB9086425.1 radical SAM protein [Pseudobdellovibrionaceae bacterium]